MAFEIVDGMTGTKHISSDDLSALNIATIGESNCVLNYGDNFKLTMTNANTATLGTGVGMVGGKRFWNQAATSLTIQSGTQGQKRNDLVVARYAKTSDGIESITPVVIKGTTTTGTAADPEVTANDLKLWRVPLDGISVGEPVKLFEPVASLATIGDSVSQPGSWIQHKSFTGRTSASGNLTFEGLEYGRFVVICAIPINDVVAIPYYQTPGQKLLGAHIIKDTNTYEAVTNANVTVDVWYYEIP